MKTNLELKEVTLDNLEESTPQEVFNWIATKLLEQNEKSMDYFKGNCALRSVSGETILRCAIGQIITDEQYSSKWEGFTWSRLVETKKVPSAHAALLTNLQQVHDYLSIEKWALKLEDLAIKYSLTTEVIQDYL